MDGFLNARKEAIDSFGIPASRVRLLSLAILELGHGMVNSFLRQSGLTLEDLA